jgi:hypothetical protein
MIVPLGRDLLALYLRYHDFGGRHSVVVTVDGKSVQVESGPVLAFFAKAIEPLNRFLVEELHRRPLSPARVLRRSPRAPLPLLRYMTQGVKTDLGWTVQTHRHQACAGAYRCVANHPRVTPRARAHRPR